QTNDGGKHSGANPHPAAGWPFGRRDGLDAVFQWGIERHPDSRRWTVGHPLSARSSERAAVFGGEVTAVVLGARGSRHRYDALPDADDLARRLIGDRLRGWRRSSGTRRWSF